MFLGKKGKWINMNGDRVLVSPGVKTVAISTSSIFVSSEQLSDFHSVRGTDKISGITEKATTSLQTAQAGSSRTQA
jgi:hypothetical protein